MTHLLEAPRNDWLVNVNVNCTPESRDAFRDRLTIPMIVRAA